MIEVKQTHLPLLAWRWQNGRYTLIHDDLPVGELAIARSGRAQARYHDSRWTFEHLGPGHYRIHDGDSGKVIASLQLKNSGQAEEGDLLIAGTVYHCLRDSHKTPPQVSISRGKGGQPLLQFRQEEENRGRIQIDDLPAADSQDFDLLTFTGLYLYLVASPDLRTSIVRSAPPPRSPVKDEGDGGDGPWNPWLPSALALAFLGIVWALQSRIRRKVSS
jgi:hypothetical protein